MDDHDGNVPLMGASAAIGVLTAVGIILSMIDLKFIQDSFIGKFELAAPSPQSVHRASRSRPQTSAPPPPTVAATRTTEPSNH